MQLVFVATIFASAFLIFLVQPMVGKRILPWFGGAPRVWMVCLAFYQTALFLGYAYAHLLIRLASPVQQLGIHCAAVAAALLALPVLPGEIWRPGAGEHPTLAIVLLLAANVATPFLVLASTGPLIQAWFARRHPGRSPYPLYAVSNIGSFLALFAYPILLEPNVPLSATGSLWSFAFAISVIGVLVCAALAQRAGGDDASARGEAGPGLSLSRDGVRIALWFLFSGCAVVLLMGVTNELCLDVASVPLLWIVPLAAYLLTFIICFASERTYRRAPYLVVGGVTILFTAGYPLWEPLLDKDTKAVVLAVPLQIAAYSAMLFSTCSIMHGELYRLRPAPRSLTAFYLCVSAGGALGGLFVGILAPMIFHGYHELTVGVGLAWLLVLAACYRDPKSWLSASAPRRRWAAAGSLTLLLLMAGAWTALRVEEGVLHQERSFFGVLVVADRSTPNGDQRRLTHGRTMHGMQMKGLRHANTPTSYYGRVTGIGLAMSQQREEGQDRVAVVGLGAGTLAAYGAEGGLVRFYEIDPAVVEIARDSGFFTFLSGSAAETEVVLGDARLAMEDEQARGVEQNFDTLVVDAFSSDAIPVHLLTREAFEIYEQALAPHGLLAIHISNRHFNLFPLVLRMGHEIGLAGMRVQTKRNPRLHSGNSEWAFLSRDSAQLRGLAAHVRRAQQELGLPSGDTRVTFADTVNLKAVPVWTDDYSDLFRMVISQRGGQR